MTDKLKTMICLVGEQPIPNLLPIRYWKPDQVLLAATARTQTVSEKLALVIRGQCDVCRCNVDPYDIATAQRDLEDKMDKMGLENSSICFNITGGTKPMSIAAFSSAKKREAPIMYLESERGKSCLYRYACLQGDFALMERTEVSALLTIEDYLTAHLGTQWGDAKGGNKLEEIVRAVLEPSVSEVKSNIKIGPNVEIDLIVRCGNQVGAVEITEGKSLKAKIDQLSSACGRELLGTFTKRFLVVTRALDPNNEQLAKERQVTVIQVETIAETLSEASRRLLIESVGARLGVEKIN
ncbi:MAG: hypothetical protein DMF61_18590 [Blastocatellia bacterium AA13]|nr:MAG: hypothetical protein DMF61_18590 [Blastocatellia bacterium AA13]